MLTWVALGNAFQAGPIFRAERDTVVLKNDLIAFGSQVGRFARIHRCAADGLELDTHSR